MASLYVYLVASLPLLHFQMQPPFSFARFLELCADLIPEEDLKVLQHLPEATNYTQGEFSRSIIKEWVFRDMALRNELVKLRAQRKHKDALAYLRLDLYFDPMLVHVALAAQRNPSPQDAEKILDQWRWNALEELATGNFFNLDYLIIYAYKLKILQRWERMRNAESLRLLEEALKGQEALH